MMKTEHQKNRYIFFLIGLFVLLLASCSGTPRRYLAADASLVRPGQAQSEVLQLLGRPDASRINEAGQQEWYFYETRRPFWYHIPLLGKRLGGEKAEALQVVFEAGGVAKAVYYVPRR